MGTATRHFYFYNQSQSCDRSGKIKKENVLLKMCVIEKLYINACKQEEATICEMTATKYTLMSAFHSLHILIVNPLGSTLISFFIYN